MLPESEKESANRLTHFHIIYESGGMKKKEIADWEENNKSKHFLLPRYTWKKLIVCDSDVTIFVQIRLTQECSSFTILI